MCGRFTLTLPTYEGLAETLGVPFDPEVAALYRPRYNVAPTDLHFVLREKEGVKSIVPAKWGLIPHFSKDARAAAKHINARGETVARLPAFRGAFERRRCAVPADGFFEWKATEHGKAPIWFHAESGELLLFAGLYERWNDPTTGALVRTFSIVTTAANDLVAPVHDRMPVVLAREDVEAWIAGAPAEASRLIRPAPLERLVATPVSTRVSSVKNDDPACLAPPDETATPAAPAKRSRAAAKEHGRDASRKKATTTDDLPLFRTGNVAKPH